MIKQIAEAEKYDIVFQEAVYISPRIDITDKGFISLISSQPIQTAASAWSSRR